MQPPAYLVERDVGRLKRLSLFTMVLLTVSILYTGVAFTLLFGALSDGVQQQPSNWLYLGLGEIFFSGVVGMLLQTMSRVLPGLGPGVVVFALRTAVRNYVVMSFAAVGTIALAFSNGGASSWLAILAISILAFTVRSLGVTVDNLKLHRSKLQEHVAQLNRKDPGAIEVESLYNAYGIFHWNAPRTARMKTLLVQEE